MYKIFPVKMRTITMTVYLYSVNIPIESGNSNSYLVALLEFPYLSVTI